MSEQYLHIHMGLRKLLVCSVRKRKNFFENFPVLGLNQFWVLVYLKKSDCRYDKGNSCRSIIHVELSIEISHFTGKTTRILSDHRDSFRAWIGSISDWFEFRSNHVKLSFKISHFTGKTAQILSDHRDSFRARICSNSGASNSGQRS